ncbi:hypothetical protein [Spiroplasma endosymbiont of Amphibalanus improvisus]|uniref:hypothetical protein n=1 Tax=Spiroplasma endosymbiont of Amphibalanus improvisus TaxID=3066327 RepID=UPI00313DBABA
MFDDEKNEVEIKKVIILGNGVNINFDKNFNFLNWINSFNDNEKWNKILINNLFLKKHQENYSYKKNNKKILLTIGQLKNFRSIILREKKYIEDNWESSGIEFFIQNLFERVESEWNFYQLKNLNFNKFKLIFNIFFHSNIISMSYKLISDSVVMRHYFNILKKFDYYYTLNYDTIIDVVAYHNNLVGVYHIHGQYNLFDNKKEIVYLKLPNELDINVFDEILLKDDVEESMEISLEKFQNSELIKRLDDEEDVEYEVSILGVNPDSDEHIFEELFSKQKIKKINYYYFNNYKKFKGSNIWEELEPASILKEIVEYIDSEAFPTNNYLQYPYYTNQLDINEHIVEFNPSKNTDNIYYDMINISNFNNNNLNYKIKLELLNSAIILPKFKNYT